MHAAGLREDVVESADARGDTERGLRVTGPDFLEDPDLLDITTDRARQGELHRLTHRLERVEARRAPGIAGHEDHLVRRGASAGDLQPVLRTVRNVVGREGGGLAVLGDVRAEEREITGVARPLPVVGLAPEVTDAGRRRVHEPHVADLQLGDGEIAQSLEERGDGAAVTLLFLPLGGEGLLAALDQVVIRATGRAGGDVAGDRGGDVLHRHRDENPRTGPAGQFVGAARGQEAVHHEITVGPGVELQRGLHAVVVGDDQAVGGDKRGAAPAE